MSHAAYAPLAPAPLEANRGLTNLLVRMPQQVRDTFTNEQIAALAWATSAVETQHVLAKRRTFGFLGNHFYVAMFLGRCRRHRPTRLERFIHRGLKHSRRYRAVRLALFSGVAVAGVTGLVLGLYVVKSALHIDLMAGPSFMHDLVF